MLKLQKFKHHLLKKAQKIDYIILWILIAILIFFILYHFNEPLWEQDEAAYAGFSIHFLIEPHHHFLPDFPLSEPHRKPPLFFVMISFFYKFLGINEFSTRIINFVIVISFIFILPYFIINYLGIKRKIIIPLTVFIFISLLIINVYVRIALTDFLLLFFQMLMIFSNYFFLTKRYQRLNGMILLISLSLGTLTKAHFILFNFIVLNFIFLILLLLFKNYKYYLKSFIILVLILCLSTLPFLFWIINLYYNGFQNFIIWFFDWYFFKRTYTSVFGQTSIPGTYLILFLITTIPWNIVILKVIYNSSKYFINKVRYFLNYKNVYINIKILYEISLFLSLYLIFEFIPSKLPSYILSIYIIFIIWLIRYFYKNKITILHIILKTLIVLIFIQSFINFTSSYRGTSKEIGLILHQNCNDKNIIISENIRLPGIVYYYITSYKDNYREIKSRLSKIQTFNPLNFHFEQIQQNCFLLNQKEYLLLSGILKEKKQIHYEGWIWDKGKKENFVILY